MTTQLQPDRLALPPPLDLDLVDAGRVPGWITEDTVGFRGFGDETEAVHAAWVAHRTIARRLARTQGGRPVPVDIEPLAIQRVDGREMILASGRPIATLVRPGADSRTGVDSFGFELPLPTPVMELQARGMAYLVYRTLRKSGIRWAMWRPGAQPARERATARASVEAGPASAQPIDAITNAGPDRRSNTERNERADVASRESPGLTKVALVVLPLSVSAVLVAGAFGLVTIPLTAALLAGMGAAGVIVFGSGRLG